MPENEEETAAEETAPAEPDFKAEAEKWKALSRKHEAQAKANAEAAKKLSEMDDATKSEVERAIARAEAAEKKASEAESKALRLEVAAAKGLSPSQARRLVGSTAEELEADADELLESFKPADTASTSDTGKPREKLQGGAVSSETEDEPSIKDVLDAIPRN